MIYLGLGTNEGDRFQQIISAMKLLEQNHFKIIKSSSIYESKAWGFQSENTFFNSVIAGSYNETPENLLSVIQSIELELGRQQKSLNKIYQDRPIDIDILFFNKEVINKADLHIPHPLLQKRNFVLKPLNELTYNMLDSFELNYISKFSESIFDDSSISVVHSEKFVNEFFKKSI